MPNEILALLEHAENAKQISDCLESSGCHVFLTNSFQKAMQILRQNTIDLIISDVHLENGGSVFDFLRWAKDDPLTKNIPFVLFSAQPSELAKYVADGVRTAARLLGSARYVTMDNFDPVVFRQEIESLLLKDHQTPATEP